MAVRKAAKKKRKTKRKITKKRASKKAKRKASKKSRKNGTKKKTPFRLSPKVRRSLPKAHRERAVPDLWKKSGGICALCDDPLGDAPENIVPDHKIPVADDGVTTLTNLYLAHRSCNASRQHLPFDIAKPLVKFKVLADNKSDVTFDDVLDEYVEKKRKEVKVERRGDEITLKSGHWSARANVFVDPATGCQYFFYDLPVSCIQNDVEVQPRLIMHQHVRKLALDFVERPVHEPSNCRLVMTGSKSAKLLQFDGQHKTTAQILIGRDTVPVKVYIEPEIPMLQQLVVKIQQEIKKQPLTRSDTLAKLGDVIAVYIENYPTKKGRIRTEKGLVAAQPDRKTQSEVRKLYFEELKRIIFFDEDNKLTTFFKPGVRDRLQTDKVIIDKLIRPLVYTDLLEIDMDASGGRDEEREAIVMVLNKICDEMLGPKIRDKDSLQYKRAKTFFLGGAIGWWMQEILIPSMRWTVHRIGDKKPLFVDSLSEDEQSHILALIERLCSWDIWSDDDEDVLRAMRDNTVKNVVSNLATNMMNGA